MQVLLLFVYQVYQLFFQDKKDNNKRNLIGIKSDLKNKGFYEVINFPFTSIENESSITLDNPLDSNKKNLRREN